MKAIKGFFIILFALLGLITLALAIIGPLFPYGPLGGIGAISFFICPISFLIAGILASSKKDNYKRLIYFDDLDGIG